MEGQHLKGWKLRGKGKSKDKAGTADAESGEPNGVWLADAAISDDEDDWLREVDEEDILTICTETDEDEEPKSSYCSALLTGESLQTGQRMILFDSGTSCHMSSYVDKFTVAEARSGRRLPFTGKRGRDPARRAPNSIGCLGLKASNGIGCHPNSASWATRGARA